MEIRFPGGLVVEARDGENVIRTDQPVGGGGGGTAPSPFDLFLASIGTCAGYYALSFCRARGIPTDDLELSVAFEKSSDTKLISRVRIEVRLPAGFPDAYRAAIVRSIDQCTVKRHLVDPPTIEVVTL